MAGAFMVVITDGYSPMNTTVPTEPCRMEPDQRPSENARRRVRFPSALLLLGGGLFILYGFLMLIHIVVVLCQGTFWSKVAFRNSAQAELITFWGVGP
jgi:hypothetical protein